MKLHFFLLSTSHGNTEEEEKKKNTQGDRVSARQREALEIKY